MLGFLARYKGQSRRHTESDLRVFLNWCLGHGLDPLEVPRPHIELYLRWMQERQQYKPSTVSRRLSVLTVFYRTCVIDEVLELDGDGMMATHVSGTDPWDLLVRGAEAANWVILPIDGPTCLTGPGQREELPEGLDDHVVFVETGADLLSAITAI